VHAMDGLDTGTMRRMTLDDDGWREPLELAVGLDLLAAGAVAVVLQDPSVLVLAVPGLVVGLPVVVLLLRAGRPTRRRALLAATLLGLAATAGATLAGPATSGSVRALLVLGGTALASAASGFLAVDARPVRRRLGGLSPTARRAAAAGAGVGAALATSVVLLGVLAAIGLLALLRGAGRRPVPASPTSA
jgi:hypothetical protein